MCIDTVLWAFKQEHLTGAERYVLIALANHTNKSGVCWPSLAAIRKFTGLSERKVRSCLRRLESLGYVRTAPRYEKNQRRSSLYTLDTRHDMPGHPAHDAGLGGHVVPTEPVIEPVIEPEVPAAGAATEKITLTRERGTNTERRFAMDQENVRHETIVDEPPKARLFREGKTILVSLGLSESRSGAVIGQWLKKTPDADGILAALVYARDQGVIEPIGYVTRLLNSGGKTNGYRQEEPAAERAYKLAEQARELERQAGFGRQDDVVRRH